jgi:hypothetical protein
LIICYNKLCGITFGYDVLFVRQWYFVHVILAACWNLENNLSADLFLDLAAKTHKLI